jgi:hypothetical protein
MTQFQKPWRGFVVAAIKLNTKLGLSGAIIPYTRFIEEGIWANLSVRKKVSQR